MGKMLLFVLFTAVPLLAQEEPGQLLARSTAWLGQEAYEQAALGFERYLQLFPYSLNRGQALLGAGQARFMLRDYERALRHFDQGLQQAADQVQKRNLLQWKAYLLESLGKEEEAQSFWEAALEMASSPTEAMDLRLRLVRNFHLRGRWEEVLDRSETLGLSVDDPRWGFVITARINSALKLERLDLAQRLLDEAQQGNPAGIASQLESFRAELQFKSRPGETNHLWEQLNSNNPLIVRAAAVRLLTQYQNDRQGLQRLARWVETRPDTDAALSLNLWMRLAELAEQEGVASRAYWQRAWDLRDKTQVGQGVLLRLVLATASTDPELALNLLREASTQDLETRLVLWQVLSQSDRNREAVDLGRRLIQEYPNHPDRPAWLVRQAILAARLREWSEVDDMFLQAGAEVNRSETWLRLLVHVWQARGRSAESHRYRQRLADLVPGNPVYQTDLLKSAISLGLWDQARELLQRLGSLAAFQQPPWSQDLTFYRGLLALREKKSSEADRLWAGLPEEAAIRADLRPQVLFYRAWLDVHLENPRLTAARRRLELLLRDYPSHGLANPARLLLGRTLALAGDINRAIEVYQAAAQGAERVEALLALSDLNLGQGRRDQARSLLETLAREYPAYRVQVRRRLIDVEVQSQYQAPRLIELYRDHPNDPLGQLALFEAATLLSDAEDWDSAAPIFDQFARLYPQHERAEAATVLGANAWLKAGKPREALLLLGLAENLRQDLKQRVQIQLLKARAYQELGRYAEAARALRSLPPEEARSAEVSRQLAQLRLLDQGRDKREAELMALLENPGTEAATIEAVRLDLLAYWLDRPSWSKAEFEDQMRLALASRQPANRAQAELLQGRYLEASGKNTEAVESYLRSARTVGVRLDTAAEAFYRAWNLMRTLSPEQAPAVRQILINRFADTSWAERAQREAP